MGIQLVAVLFIFAWTFTIMGCYFFFLNTMGWFRIDPLEEEVGMDLSRHKGSAYNMETGSAKPEDILKLENSRHGRTGSIKHLNAENADAAGDGDDAKEEVSA
jgi:Amt family ammonium transporter